MEKRSRLQPLARAVLRTQSDQRLVALARDGKEAAFEEIVRRYRTGLVAFAAAYGPPDPEDVVQESLIRSWDALRESTGEMHLKAWLYTIVRNRSLNARRDSRPHEQLTDEVDGVPQPPEIVLSNDELRRAVAAIVALPATQREALVRSAVEGHSHEQIAAVIGSTPGAVRGLIYRARMTVRHGVGAVIPLPLVAALAELGAGGTGAAAGGAAGGAAAAGAAGGASLVAKTAIVAAIGAVAIGSGAAIKHAGDSGKSSDQGGQVEAVEVDSSGSSDDPVAAETTVATDETSTGVDDNGRNRGEGGSGGSDDGPGHGSGDDSGGGRSGGDGRGDGGPGSAGSGPGPSGSGPEHGDDSSGRGPGPGDDGSPNSGPGSGSSGSDDAGSGHSGSGHSGSGHSGSGHSGSGSSGSGSSGSGSSGSGSGHSGGGSSGSGDDGASPGTTATDGGHSGPGGGGDTTTTPETTVPEPDNSGPGSGSSGSD